MIAREYRRLDLKLGWRFLYTPACTLASETPLAFVGLNPGDDKYRDPILSVENGNAYCQQIEDWWGPRQQACLQTQVCRLYESLAAELGTTTEKLMNHQTLAMNFCPFRSQRWDQLDRQTKNELIAFSRGMWARVLEIVEPRVIVCLGKEPMRYLGRVLEARGARPAGPEQRTSAGWGNCTYGIRCYTTSYGQVTMVRIPHLSTYTIFGRPESEPATTDIVSTISKALRTATT